MLAYRYPQNFGQVPSSIPGAPPTSPPGSTPSWVVPVIVVGVVGLVGFLIYESMKMTSQMVHEQGVGKTLEFEGGTAAIGALSRAFDRNPRRRRKRRR